MIKIWAQWINGSKEIVDETDNEWEALYLVQEYRMAFGSSATVWIQGVR